MDGPCIYRVLFLITRALANRKASPSGAPGCSIPSADGKQGFILTGDVILPSGRVSIPGIGSAAIPVTGMDTPTETHSVGQYVEVSGTIAVSSDCTNSATLNFYQAGQLIRIFYLTGITGADGNAIQMTYMFPPPHDDYMAEASS
jgi:hypothetical protein